VVVRAAGTVVFPARFTLVAAANPCPCGFDGDLRRACVCAPNRVEAYRQRLSGPLLDRIDLRLRVPRLTRSELLGSSDGESSKLVRERVEEARERQHQRFRGEPIRCNGEMSGAMARRASALTPAAEEALAAAVDRYNLTGRGFDRALKVARTVADLDRADRVDSPHLLEALSFREGLARPEDAGAA
jgi:magnesium chelatase family protein